MLEATLGTRIGFGHPVDADQAWIRLPDITHPLYKEDRTFEHLAHLKDWYWSATELMAQGRMLPFGERFVPLAAEDMVFMQGISFRRGDKILTADWEYIPYDLAPWCRLLPTEDDCYRWWQICKVYPQPVLSEGISLVSIEMNSGFNLDGNDYRTDKKSEFEIGLVTEDELRVLLERLGRSSR